MSRGEKKRHQRQENGSRRRYNCVNFKHKTKLNLSLKLQHFDQLHKEDLFTFSTVETKRICLIVIMKCFLHCYEERFPLLFVFFFLPTLSLFTSSDNVFFNQTTMSNQCSVYPFILCCCRNTFVMHVAARDWISIKGLSRAILVSWEIKPLPFSAQRKLFF